MNHHLRWALCLPCLVLTGGAVALIVYRRRAPRATLLALPVVVLLAVFTAYVPARALVQAVGLKRGRPPEWVDRVYGWGHSLSSIAFPVVLVVAAMMDRRPRGRDGTA